MIKVMNCISKELKDFLTKNRKTCDLIHKEYKASSIGIDNKLLKVVKESNLLKAKTD
jgi:hypothetical protein